MKRHGFHGVERLARCPPQPPQAGLDRRLRHPRPRVQGRADGGPDGQDRVTTQNVTVHAVDAEKGLMLIKGAVPGPNGGLVWSHPRQAAKKSGDGGHDRRTDAAGKTSGTVDLPAEIFGVALNVPLIHQVVVAQQAAARQGTHSTKTRGEVRGGGKQALQAEGHRPRTPGLDAGAAVRRRWRRARPAAAQLRPAHAQEDEGRRPARCALRPGPQRPDPRRGRARHRRQALDEDRAGRAARAVGAHEVPRRDRAQPTR